MPALLPTLLLIRCCDILTCSCGLCVGARSSTQHACVYVCRWWCACPALARGGDSWAMLITLCDTCALFVLLCVCVPTCVCMAVSCECRPSWHLNTTQRASSTLGGRADTTCWHAKPRGVAATGFPTALLAVAVLCQQPGTHNSVAGGAHVRGPCCRCDRPMLQALSPIAACAVDWLGRGGMSTRVWWSAKAASVPGICRCAGWHDADSFTL